MSTHEDYTFVCPDCTESIAVNAAMKDALVRNGCVICGARVPSDAFKSD